MVIRYFLEPDLTRRRSQQTNIPFLDPDEMSKKLKLKLNRFLFKKKKNNNNCRKSKLCVDILTKTNKQTKLFL